MKEKPFKNIDEQLNILESRGLQILNRKQAAEFLLHHNYYRVSGYSLTLRKHDKFDEDAVFQNIIDIYEFDHELRHILLKYIEIIEVDIKSLYSHEFSRLYGSAGYLDVSLFTNQQKHQEIISKSEKQKEARHQHEAYLKHFLDESPQPVPLWAYVELFTISDISFLYAISPQPVQEKVAFLMGLRHKNV